ncbi:hypothetical protein B0H34DRAFT_656625 [Crassisporium funariophilum]|nr:hypothetical protein B0H34DRAFT_656625 [Crassisporium funariophilum]
MKATLASLSCIFLATAAMAQRIAIGYPADGTAVIAGSNILLEVDRPNSLSASAEVAIVVGIQSCNNGPCNPPDLLGSILYNGPFHPQFQPGVFTKPPHQNYTVTIPQTIAQGPALLSVYHVALIGASQSIPFTETQTITLNVL